MASEIAPDGGQTIQKTTSSSNIGALREYEKKVVDLTRRNRLLKYPARARAISFKIGIADFEQRFGAIEEMAVEFPHKAILNEEEESEETEADATIPPTDIQGKKLITMLQALRLDSKKKFEEHGLHTLYLTIGRVQWKEPGNGRGSEGALDDSAYDYDAPMILVPISIEETRSSPKKTIVKTYLEANDIVVNPVLLLLSQLEYGVQVTGLPPLEGITSLAETFDVLVGALKKSFSESKIKHNITDDIRIGQYSFYGQQIYEDLQKNEVAICGHEFIDALIGKGSIVQKGLPQNSEPDDLLAAEEDFTVLDADVSQLRVIQKAIQGNSMVVQGPPGTGKSQTIVNLVSNLLARGKRVLVVCEKQVALEVVFKRLKDKGLDKLCLPLFYQNADKKTFAKSVINDRDYLIEAYGQGGSNDDAALASRENARVRLKNYARSLATVVDPLNRSVQWVHGELARAQALNADRSLPWGDSDPLVITEDTYRRILGILDAVAPVLHKIADPRFSAWSRILKENFSPDFASRVRVVLENTHVAVSELQELMPMVGIKTVADLQQNIETIEKLALLAGEALPIALHEETGLNAAIRALSEAEGVASAYQKLANDFGGNYKVPASWTPINLNSQPVGDDCTMNNVSTAMRSASSVEVALAALQANAGSCGSGDLLQLPIADLLRHRDILALDPMVMRIKNWSDASSLQASLGSLATLHAIHSKCQEANAVFEKWAIIREDLRKEDIQKVLTEFGKKYHRYFRFFSRDYSSVKGIVSGWCNLNAPTRYADVSQVVAAVRDGCNLEEKLGVLLAQFNERYIVSGKLITTFEIPILAGSVKMLSEWMRQESKSEIPHHLKQIIESNSDLRAMKAFGETLKDLESLLKGTWSIFDTLSDLEHISIAHIVSQVGELTERARYILGLEDAVGAYLVRSEGADTRTLSVLERDIQRLNELKACLDRVPADTFQILASESTSSLIDKREALQITVAKLKELLECAVSLPGQQDSISLHKAMQLTQEARANITEWKSALTTYEGHASALNALFENEKSLSVLEPLKIQEFQEKLSEMIQDQEGLEVWMEYRRYAHQMKDLGYSWFLEALKGSDIKNPAALFAESLWNAWLEHRYILDPHLRNFNVSEHKKIIDEFRALERRVLDVNAKRILRRAAPRIKMTKERRGEAERFLLHQSQLQQRQKPVRQVVMKCTSHIQQYKPCWMMSPLTLSSYIPYGSLDFDTVIFDEASQMRVEHALGAIARGKQIIIFGDEHQLPPTSFFDVVSDDESEEAEEQDYESILHAARTVLPESSDSLLYHYRSKYEDLIAFSNCEVYKDQLITFPNPDHTSRGVRFEYVENGVFDGGIAKEGHAGTRRNDIEAARVVEMCAQSVANEPNKSLGVIAFSKSQEIAIRDAMITFLKEHPDLQDKLNEDQDGSDTFFIKNLESVQGDERDVIILSVGYGKDKNGNFFNRFGPINSVTGYRRLNVAITRAKEKLICVSSFKSTEMKAGETSRGAKMLQKYLDYAENGVKTLDGSRLVAIDSDAEADSPFELEVKRALEGRGYEVRKQVGVSGFKIDLAIVNPKTGADYILGIECDGASYHSSYSARVNDRLREDILRRLGWDMYRIWSQHWVSHKEMILDDIVAIVNKNSY